MIRLILVALIALGTLLPMTMAEARSAIFVANLKGNTGLMAELPVQDTRNLRKHIAERMQTDAKLYILNSELKHNDLLAADAMLAGGIDGKTAMQVGESIGARYIVYGSVLDIGTVENPIDLANVSLDNKKLKAHISLKVVDTLTGKLVGMVTADGSSATNTKLTVWSDEGEERLTLGGGRFSRRSVNAALYDASDNAIEKLLAKKSLK